MVFEDKPGTDTAGFARYNDLDADFGYKTEDACTLGQYWNYVGDHLGTFAGMNSNGQAELKVEQFLSMVAKGTYAKPSTQC